MSRVHADEAYFCRGARSVASGVGLGHAEERGETQAAEQELGPGRNASEPSLTRVAHAARDAGLGIGRVRPGRT